MVKQFWILAHSAVRNLQGFDIMNTITLKQWFLDFFNGDPNLGIGKASRPRKNYEHIIKIKYTN